MQIPTIVPTNITVAKTHILSCLDLFLNQVQVCIYKSKANASKGMQVDTGNTNLHGMNKFLKLNMVHTSIIIKFKVHGLCSTQQYDVNRVQY